MKIIDNFINLIGKTPLINATRYARSKGVFNCNIFAKMEQFNPTGSIKDRAALFMIEELENDGALKNGGTVVEATSGNLGIALSALCAVKGYRSITVMPKGVSVERVQMIKAYGGEVVLTDGKKGMTGAVERADEIVKSMVGAVKIDQFSNPLNAKAHYLTTGLEIWQGLGERVDFLVVGVGTGGTLSGTARLLKEKKPTVKVIAVEPYKSPFLSCKKVGVHQIQGIGAGFLPPVLDTSLIDEVFTVKDEEAFQEARDFAKAEGLLVGASSGAALFAAKEIFLRPTNEGKTAAVILPDGGLKYLSLKGFLNN